MSKQSLRIRDLGYSPGRLPTGPSNSILDVPGVHISQVTIPTNSDLQNGSNAAKGVTVISPRPPKEYYKPCRASVFTFNGNGETTGTHQIADWGFTSTPIAWTNSISVGVVFDTMWQWILDQQDALGWDSLSKSRHYATPVVGETADWIINSHTRASRIEPADARRCFDSLHSLQDGATVQEGQFGGGAGMTTHMFTGGTGTSSRVVGDAESGKQYTLAAICQSNYGTLTHLSIGGVPVGKLLEKEFADKMVDPRAAGSNTKTSSGGGGGGLVDPRAAPGGRAKDGSIIMLVITDAPLATHQLNRIARHATVGLAAVGTRGVGMTFSGDIFVALSTAESGPEQVDDFRRPRPVETYTAETIKNESIDAFFEATAEAVEEAVLNCMVAAREGKVAMDGTEVHGMPVQRVRELLEKHLVRVES